MYLWVTCNALQAIVACACDYLNATSNRYTSFRKLFSMRTHCAVHLINYSRSFRYYALHERDAANGVSSIAERGGKKMFSLNCEHKHIKSTRVTQIQFPKRTLLPNRTSNIARKNRNNAPFIFSFYFIFIFVVILILRLDFFFFVNKNFLGERVYEWTEEKRTHSSTINRDRFHA